MKDFEVNEENITQVDSRQVFEWVKTGKWNLAKFQLWYFESLRLQSSVAVESFVHHTHTSPSPKISNKA